MLFRTRMTATGPCVSLAALCVMALMASCGESRDSSDPLAEVAAAYRTAIRNHPAIQSSTESTSTAEKLRSIARRADSAGRNGNIDAAAILASGIHAKAGAIALHTASSIQSQVTVTMDTIGQLIDDAVLLDASAQSRESLNLASSREYLANERADANSRLAEAESQLDGIREPIKNAITNRETNKTRAAQLDAEAAGLAQQGLDAGPLQGHGFIEESIDLRRQAHGQRISAAREELTLVELQPNQRIAEKGRQSQQSRLDAARDSESQTESRRNEAADYAQSIRSQIDAIRERLSPIFQQLATEQTQTILPGFDAAAKDFAASASAAKKATRSDSAEQKSTAWMAVTSGELGAGRVHWAMANSLESQADLLKKLAKSGDLLGEESRWRNDLDTTLQAHGKAIEAAKASYQAALQSLGNVRGHAQEINRIRESIDLAVKAMEGADLVAMESDRRSESTTAKRPTRPWRKYECRASRSQCSRICKP